MSATDELRRLLDERGVEYKSATYVLDHTGTKIEETVWQVHGVRNIYTEYPTGIKNLIIEYLEPEQAIAATLGGQHAKLTAEQVREAIEANSWAETSTIREFNDSSWQAIADELNAALGGDGKSRWFELFGTPELAARTLIDCNAFKQCVDCPVCHDEHGETCEIPGDCAFVMRDYHKLLEWLRGEGEGE